VEVGTVFSGFHTFIDKSITGTPHVIAFQNPGCGGAVQLAAGVNDVICGN
jgi:hypothetical protein